MSATELPRWFPTHDIAASKIHEVVKQGDLQQLQNQYAKNPDCIKTIDSVSQTLLHVACYEGHLNVVQFLLQELNGELIDHQDKNGWTALHCATDQGHLAIVMLLLNKGADPRVTTRNGSSPLHYLARVNMETNLSVSSNEAIQNLRSKLNCQVPEEKESLSNSQNILQRFASVMNDKLDREDLPSQVVQLMIDKGADINAQKNNGETPLMQACFKGLKYNFFMLLSKGAYAFSVNKNGDTCFDYAQRCEHYDIVAILKVLSSLFKWVPNDIVREIFSYLDCKSLLMVSRVCKMFKDVADNDIVWSHAVSREFNIKTKDPQHSWKQIYQHTVGWRHKFDHIDIGHVEYGFDGQYDRLYKVMLQGDSGVGKSSLLLRYADDTFTEAYIPTIGVDFKIKSIVQNGFKTKLQIWDIAGYERFRTIARNPYRGAQGIVICFDVTDRKSFDHVKRWLGEIDRYACENVNKLIVGCKADLIHHRTVSYDTAKEFCDSVNIDYIETSSKLGVNLEKVFGLISKAITMRIPPSTKPPSIPLVTKKPPPSKCNVM